jgi:hypothetical protein
MEPEERTTIAQVASIVAKDIGMSDKQLENTIKKLLTNKEVEYKDVLEKL